MDWSSLEREANRFLTAITAEVGRLHLRETEILQGIDEFIEKYYVETGDEESLREALINSKHLIVHTGNRGSGKTTLITRVVRELARKSIDGIIYMDFNEIHSRLPHMEEPSPSDEQRQAVHQAIENQLTEAIADRYYSSNSVQWQNRTGLDLLPQLSRMVMTGTDGPTGEAVDIPPLMGARELRGRIDAMARHSRQPWVAACWDENNGNVRGILDEIAYNALDYTQMLWGLRRFKLTHRPILIFDNIDKVPFHYQSEYLTIVKKIQDLVTNYCTCLLAIRPENLTASQEAVPLWDHGYYLLRTMDRNDPVHVPYDRVVPRRGLTHHRLQTIIQRRAHAAELSPDLAKTSRILLHMYLDDYVVNIFNSDLRLILTTHSAFMRHLLVARKPVVQGMLSLREATLDRLEHAYQKGLAGDEVDGQLPLPLRNELLSEFYGWLAKLDENQPIRVYDVVTQVRDCDAPKCCNLHHMILARLLNIAREYESREMRFQFVTVERVLSDFARIGFDSPAHTRAIKRTLMDLYLMKNGMDGHLIHLQSEAARKHLTADAIRGKDRIWITPRGRQFVRSTTHKFHFLYALICQYEEKPIGSDVREAFHDVFEFALEMMEKHLESLEGIRDSMRLGSSDMNWLQEYNFLFCINPHPSPARRQKEQSMPFHVELVLGNMSSFLTTHGSHRLVKRVERAHRHFQNQIAVIAKNGRHAKFDLNVRGEA